jgi:hypothetical protein
MLYLFEGILVLGLLQILVFEKGSEHKRTTHERNYRRQPSTYELGGVVSVRRPLGSYESVTESK